jgi:hypothetical protein
MAGVRYSQKDLFAQETVTAELPPSLRSKLEPLLRSLLSEAAGVRRPDAAAEPCEREEGDD